jgi:hypothetical protein
MPVLKSLDNATGDGSALDVGAGLADEFCMVIQRLDSSGAATAYLEGSLDGSTWTAMLVEPGSTLTPNGNSGAQCELSLGSSGTQVYNLASRGVLFRYVRATITGGIHADAWVAAKPAGLAVTPPLT